ncbi:hypothetical protein AB0G06_02055 [Nonomuraea dietziae]|uniref:hypothetical protein n=1 Tax=Nonomuraea dietziae TaxID=65515 RepID=UPI0033C99E0D
MDKPEGLGADGSRLWDEVTAEYELNAADFLLLKQAAETADLVSRISRAVVSEDLTVSRGTGGVAVNPLISELRQQRLVLARLVAALNLPDDDDEEEETSTGRVHKNQSRGANGRFGGKVRLSLA